MNGLKVLFLLAALCCMLICMVACGKTTDSEETTTKKYNVDYCGGKDMFQNAKSAYREGKKVTLYFDEIATDTSYTFYVDGETVSPLYEEGKGFVIEFTMPDHDITIDYDMRNDMEYDPEAYNGEPDDGGSDNGESDDKNTDGTDKAGSDEGASSASDKPADINDCVTVDFYEDVKSEIEDYQYTYISKTEPIVQLVFQAKQNIDHFRITSIMMESYDDENSCPVYSGSVVYSNVSFLLLASAGMRAERSTVCKPGSC